jgi:hypothetical protein
MQQIVSRAKFWSRPYVEKHWYSVWTAVSRNYNFTGTKAEIKYICQWEGINAATFLTIWMLKPREVHRIYRAEGKPVTPDVEIFTVILHQAVQ